MTKEERVTELYQANKSYNEIAKLCGLTKNQVAGIVFRWRKSRGLVKVLPKEVKERIRKAVRAKRPVVIKPLLEAPTATVIPLERPAELASTDRWVPLVNTLHWSCRYEQHGKYCNKACQFGARLYCAEHAHSYYQQRRSHE